VPEPEIQRVIAYARYPDDPPLEFVYREDGSVEQLSGPPGIVVGFEPVSDNGPRVLVKIEHSEGFQPVKTAWCGSCRRQVTTDTAEDCFNCAAIWHGEANSVEWRAAHPDV
jgi:hypothetical protein